MQKIIIDLLGLLGFCGFTYGAYLEYGTATAAMIAGGLLMVISAVAGLRRKADVRHAT